MKICLHIHSNFSKDSKSKIEGILNTANSLNYDIISITDHNTVRGSLEAVKLGFKTPRIIVGAEFSTQVGHILAYEIDEEVELNSKKTSEGVFDFEDLMYNIRKVGGLAFLAHPANSKIAIYYEELGLLDGIEAYNSRLNSFLYNKKSNAVIKDCTDCYDLILMGGPDAHSIEEMKNCFMNVETDSEASLLEILRKKKTIHFRKAQNFAIASAERKNMNQLRGKKVLKVSLRSLIGISEFVIHLKGKRYSTYDIIQLGEKSE